MKKLILASAALALSSSFAFAQSITQSWTANPSITNLTKAHAFAGSFGSQVAAVVGTGTISQTVTASPKIDNLTQAHATAITNVHQIGAIVP